MGIDEPKQNFIKQAVRKIFLYFLWCSSPPLIFNKPGKNPFKPYPRQVFWAEIALGPDIFPIPYFSKCQHKEAIEELDFST
jgi:hypothetical protein